MKIMCARLAVHCSYYIERDCGLMRNLSGYAQYKMKIMDSEKCIGATGALTYLYVIFIHVCKCRDVKYSLEMWSTERIRYDLRVFVFTGNFNDIFLVERMRHAMPFRSTPKRNQFNSHLNAFYESAHTHTHTNKQKHIFL